jgi:uncharacterized protein with NAD-binding domain and iron-sulfur cluster
MGVMITTIILGGGIGGMTAAHELIERGYDVVVLERQEIAGGKARSIVKNRLPGEHGFRFFPGFYKHVIDTMERIPSFNDQTVAQHVVPTSRVAICQYGKSAYVLPAGFPRQFDDATTALRNFLLAMSPLTGLTADDYALFGARLWQFMTSCAERRLHEYESIGWWEFVGAEQRSSAYQKFLAEGITRSLVAAKARTASTRTIGDIFLQLMFDIIDPAKETTDRLLDGPTNLVWIDPWQKYLKTKGVRYLTGVEVTGIVYERGRIKGVHVRQNDRQIIVYGDQFIAALPIERIAPLISGPLIDADPALANLKLLSPNVEWMNGVQYYLRRPFPITHGHAIFIDTEWALTSVSQVQFWRDVPPEQFMAGPVADILSVDISDFFAPSQTLGRAARQCSRDEVVRETWNQLKRSLSGELRDSDLHSAVLDPDIQPDPRCPGYLRNEEPLLVNLVNTWALRPQATTAIPNLFLASDYVQTETDLATMEGANEAARRAVNALLDATKFVGSRCQTWKLHEPEILSSWRAYDAGRFHEGKPWDPITAEVAAYVIAQASPLLATAAPLLEEIAMVPPLAA